jgi:hypothetical protein
VGIGRAALVVAAAAWLAGCVEEKDPAPTPVCQTSDDCAPGQDCIEHACFGAATGEFSAELFAPQSRRDMLARAEIQRLGITPEGHADIMFARSVEVTGSVLLRSTDPTSVAAKVVFRRPSRIPGAPDYVVSVDAAAGKGPGEMAFRVRLLPNEVGESYQVTIYPDDGTLATPPAGQLPPSALAPPQVVPDVHLTTNLSNFDVALDRGGVRSVSGQVVDAVGAGMPGMVVRAYGQLTSSAPLELVSSTGRTDEEGRFEIFLPTGRSSLFDLRITPGVGVRAASLVRKSVRPTLGQSVGASVLEPIRYPALPRPVRYQLPVAGADAAGGRKAALGATVIFSSTLLATATDTVTYQTQAEVGTAGLAEPDLIPGVLEQNRAYQVTVLPLANTLQGARWDASVSVGPPNPVTGDGGVLAELDLPARVLVSGTVRDADGKTVNKLTVRPQLAAGFVAGAGADLERVAAVRLPEVTTNDQGLFSVYLDRALAGLDAGYDLELLPPGGSVLPRWSRDQVSPPRDDARLELGDLGLPRASLVSGVVTDEGGTPVADAEIRVYMRVGAASARQRALAKSDQNGEIELVLPAP